MEEILASIRRIIADDDPAKESAPKAIEPPPPPPAPPPPPRPVAVAPRPAPPPQPRPAPSLPPPVAVEPEPPPAPIEEPASDILDLTEQMTTPAAGFRTIDGESDIVFEEREPEPPPPRRRPSPQVNEGALVSAATTAAVDSAFNTLAQTVLVQNGRTLEDLVKEMLRPLLKTWLDDNLPGMVERLVRAEIDRVSRGRG